MLKINRNILEKIYKTHSSFMGEKVGMEKAFNFIQLRAKGSDGDYLEVITSSTTSFSAAFMRFEAEGDPGFYVLPALKLAEVKKLDFATITQDPENPEYWELRLTGDNEDKVIRYSTEGVRTFPELDRVLPDNTQGTFQICIAAELLADLVKSVNKKDGLKFTFSTQNKPFKVELMESETANKFAICPKRIPKEG